MISLEFEFSSELKTLTTRSEYYQKGSFTRPLYHHIFTMYRFLKTIPDPTSYSLSLTPRSLFHRTTHKPPLISSSSRPSPLPLKTKNLLHSGRAETHFSNTTRCTATIINSFLSSSFSHHLQPSPLFLPLPKGERWSCEDTIFTVVHKQERERTERRRKWGEAWGWGISLRIHNF